MRCLFKEGIYRTQRQSLFSHSISFITNDNSFKSLENSKKEIRLKFQDLPCLLNDIRYLA